MREPTREPATDAEETALVDRATRGDPAAFDALVRRHLPGALVAAERLLGDRADAEDLVQDAFLRALDRLPLLDPNRPFGPWFFTLLRNLGINQLRAKRVRHTEPELLDAASPDALPDEEMERAEVRERFDAALAALTPRQREIVMLFEVEGWKGAEIAEHLGLTPENVRWHLHQAKKSLRVSLSTLRDEGTL
ncbi:MAG TPA: sigma-70 family RNA polymerase sigma factor [Gemmatimonadaceae bacterium]